MYNIKMSETIVNTLIMILKSVIVHFIGLRFHSV